MYVVKIKNHLRDIRSDYGLTQVQLADKLEISQSSLSAIECGISGITTELIVKILFLFPGVCFNDILTYTVIYCGDHNDSQ